MTQAETRWCSNSGKEVLDAVIRNNGRPYNWHTVCSECGQDVPVDEYHVTMFHLDYGTRYEYHAHLDGKLHRK